MDRGTLVGGRAVVHCAWQDGAALGTGLEAGTVRVYYSERYTVAGYSFDTTRKAGWVAEALSASPVAGVELVAPEPVTAEELAAAHDPAYIEAIRTGEPRDLAESQGFAWDPALWEAVRASTGGAVAAARAARRDHVSGSLSSGLHHARRASGAGFCTFNGLALAALDALEQGARSVLILDLDAHCGGGTYSLISDDPRIRQADVAVNLFDAYRPAGDNMLRLVFDATTYLPAIEDLLAGVARAEPYDLVLYNAGMDPYEDCEIGGLPGVTYAMLRERERMVFHWVPAHARAVAFALAGGYIGSRLSQDTLVGLHRLTVEAASEAAATWPHATS